VGSLPAERKALLFTAGHVRFALRLSQVREIVAAPQEGGEIVLRGGTLPAIPVAIALGLTPGPGRFALVTEGTPMTALRVEALHGIVELSEAEVFQLPARTLLPQPPPFQSAIVTGGEVALELAVPTLGWVPLERAAEAPGPPPELDSPPGRELLFARCGRAYAVPLSILQHVLDAPRVHPVPLTPRAHRGLLYHGRAIHPVFDVALLYGEADPGPARTALLLDAGGTAIAVVADRILRAAEALAGVVTRPSWDALFAP